MGREKPSIVETQCRIRRKYRRPTTDDNEKSHCCADDRKRIHDLPPPQHETKCADAPNERRDAWPPQRQRVVQRGTGLPAHAGARRPIHGRVRLSELRPRTVQTSLGDLAKAGAKLGVCFNAGAVLRTALNQALKWELVSGNASALVDAPSVTREDIRPLDQTQVVDSRLCVRLIGMGRYLRSRSRWDCGSVKCSIFGRQMSTLRRASCGCVRRCNSVRVGCFLSNRSPNRVGARCRYRSCQRRYSTNTTDTN